MIRFQKKTLKDMRNIRDEDIKNIFGHILFGEKDEFLILEEDTLIFVTYDNSWSIDYS